VAFTQKGVECDPAMPPRRRRPRRSRNAVLAGVVVKKVSPRGHSLALESPPAVTCRGSPFEMPRKVFNERSHPGSQDHAARGWFLASHRGVDKSMPMSYRFGIDWQFIIADPPDKGRDRQSAPMPEMVLATGPPLGLQVGSCM